MGAGPGGRRRTGSGSPRPACWRPRMRRSRARTGRSGSWSSGPATRSAPIASPSSFPALSEFAPSARLLLEKPLRARLERARSRTRIESIVATGAFHPVFQPMVDLATRRPIGYEALTRFDDGTPPDLVFAEARRCGLERELESATLRAAVAASEATAGGAVPQPERVARVHRWPATSCARSWRPGPGRSSSR